MSSDPKTKTQISNAFDSIERRPGSPFPEMLYVVVDAQGRVNCQTIFDNAISIRDNLRKSTGGAEVFEYTPKQYSAPNAAMAMEAPVAMRLHCPECGELHIDELHIDELHIDEGEFATKPHHTHACQKCGMVWRPAVVFTVGVRFLPGYKNETS